MSSWSFSALVAATVAKGAIFIWCAMEVIHHVRAAIPHFYCGGPLAAVISPAKADFSLDNDFC